MNNTFANSTFFEYKCKYSVDFIFHILNNVCYKIFEIHNNENVKASNGYILRWKYRSPTRGGLINNIVYLNLISTQIGY